MEDRLQKNNNMFNDCLGNLIQSSTTTLAKHTRRLRSIHNILTLHWYQMMVIILNS